MKSCLFGAVSLMALSSFQAEAQVTSGSGATPTADAQAQSLPTSAPLGTAYVSPSAPAVEDIVVTAQRRRERLQDVPVAVTAVSAARLAANSVTSVADIGNLTPNLTLTEQAGTVQPHIRGVGTNFSGPGVENPVALYIDGVYISNGASSLLTLNNIERVEVLKGPQGTLFGRNATGGLIQVVTKDPTQKPSGSIDLSYGNYNTSTANSYITGGLSEKLAADLAVRVEHQGDGYGRNLLTGKDVGKVNHDVALRSTLLFEPSALTTIRLTLDYSDRKSTDPQLHIPGYPATFNNAFFGGPYAFGGPYDTNTNENFNQRLRSGGAALQINQDLGSVTLQSITAYRQTKYAFDLDLDLTPVRLIDVLVNVRAQQLSQEFQLTSKGSGRFKWVAGLYLYAAKDEYDPFDILLNGAVSPVPGTQFDVHNNSAEKTRSAAAYGQASYELFDQTALTLGGRFTYEDRRLDGLEVDSAGGTVVAQSPLPIPSTGFPSKIDYKRFNYRVALDHKFTNDILGYVSYSTGFKSGGYNLDSSSNPPYKAEDIKSAEIGLKTQFFDRLLRFNIAGYHYKYTNLQVANFGIGTTIISNGAAATIYGLDFDADLALGHGLTLNGGLGYIHDRFDNYQNAPFYSGFGGCGAPPGSFCDQSASGNKLGQTPTLSYNIGGNYKAVLAASTLNLNILYSYASRYYASADNFASQPPLGLLTASALWTFADNRYSVRAWGKNLTNRVYATGILEANQGVIRQIGAPRTYGITLGAMF